VWREKLESLQQVKSYKPLDGAGDQNGIGSQDQATDVCCPFHTKFSKENLLFLMSLEEEVSHGQTWQGSILPVQVVTFKRQVF
jgi:hypothetical protein